MDLPVTYTLIKLPLDVNDNMITATGLCGLPRTVSTEPPTSMSNAVHVIRLRHIWARIQIWVYSTSTAFYGVDQETRSSQIAKVRTDLEEWRQTAPEIPPRPGKTLTVFATKAWYELNYNHTILYLYRKQLVSSDHTPENIFLDCLQAARTVCRVYRREYVGTMVKYTWSSLHCIFLAGMTYLHCLWASPVACRAEQLSEVNKTCIDCTMVLVIIAQGWQVAAPYRDLFEVLVARTTSMIESRRYGTQHGSMVNTSSDAYSIEEDWNRCLAEIDRDLFAGFDDLILGFMGEFDVDFS